MFYVIPTWRPSVIRDQSIFLRNTWVFR